MDQRIVVDNFRKKPRTPYSYVYFCSHAHADHTEGLTGSWNFGTIYCSPITRLLLINKFQLAEDVVVALEENESHLIRFGNVRSGSGLEEFVTVTLIDANHCAGSVMFLFDLRGFGRVLHTGDFRFKEEYLTSPLFKDIDLTTLIIDNTYCVPINNFPTREEAASDLIEALKLYPSTWRIAIGIDTLGKEELLMKLAIACNSKIVVNATRYNVITNILGLPSDLFTINRNEGRIQVYNRQSLTPKIVASINSKQPTVCILCSSMTPANFSCTNRSTSLTNMKTADEEAPAQQIIETADVDARFQTKVLSSAFCSHLKDLKQDQLPLFLRCPYSLHSNYDELKRFILHLKPRNVIPFSNRAEHAVASLMDIFHSYTTEQPEKQPVSSSPLSKYKTVIDKSAILESHENRVKNHEIKKLALKRKGCAFQSILRKKKKKSLVLPVSENLVELKLPVIPKNGQPSPSVDDQPITDRPVKKGKEILNFFSKKFSKNEQSSPLVDDQPINDRPVKRGKQILDYFKDNAPTRTDGLVNTIKNKDTNKVHATFTTIEWSDFDDKLLLASEELRHSDAKKAKHLRSLLYKYTDNQCSMRLRFMKKSCGMV